MIVLFFLFFLSYNFPCFLSFLFPNPLPLPCIIEKGCHWWSASENCSKKSTIQAGQHTDKKTINNSHSIQFSVTKYFNYAKKIYNLSNTKYHCSKFGHNEWYIAWYIVLEGLPIRFKSKSIILALIPSYIIQYPATPYINSTTDTIPIFDI